MDMIVDLIDQLIEERVKVALADPDWGGKDETQIAVLKEKIRRILVENVSTK
jgi:hypothetical protein